MNKSRREAVAALFQLAMSVRCPQCGAGAGSTCGKAGLHQRRTARALKWAARRKGRTQ